MINLGFDPFWTIFGHLGTFFDFFEKFPKIPGISEKSKTVPRRPKMVQRGSKPKFNIFKFYLDAFRSKKRHSRMKTADLVGGCI